MVLRDYQNQCVKIINSLKGGSYLVSMATGLGKTVVFSAIERKGRILIISHREELVHQPLKYYDCPCGVEQGEETSHGEEVVSASVQSLIRRLDKFRPDDFDIIITDEAHHAAAKSYKKVYEYFRPRLHLGFTATPNRGDKVRLDDVFESIIFERNLKWGILNGYLTDIRCLRAKISWNLKPVKMHMGDFQVGDLERAVNSEGVTKEIADVYRKYARGRTLIFAASVSHAENIASKIQGAVVVSQKTKNREQIIKDFTDGKIPCLVNCMIFTEGTDIPLIETVIIARPTKNQSLYAQMVGRGLRKAEGKPYLNLIDLVGVTDDLDICTAPSLLGLDLNGVPKSRAYRIEGMLTNLKEVVDEASDCPQNWVVNVKAVRLFADSEGVNTYNVNWTKKPNGDLVYQFADGDRIGIKAINELGKTKLMLYCFDETEKRFKYSEGKETGLQEALTDAYDYFNYRRSDEKALWNLDNYYLWQNYPATEKQIAYIKSKLSKEDFDEVYKNGLRKGDCAQIINALKIKNATKEELLRLHAAKELKNAEDEKLKQELAKLKIEYIFNSKFKNKFYAVKSRVRLVVTDSWEVALKIIGEIEATNEKCHYKKFLSKAQAVAFLRN